MRNELLIDWPRQEAAAAAAARPSRLIAPSRRPSQLHESTIHKEKAEAAKQRRGCPSCCGPDSWVPPSGGDAREEQPSNRPERAAQQNSMIHSIDSCWPGSEGRSCPHTALEPSIACPLPRCLLLFLVACIWARRNGRPRFKERSTPQKRFLKS